VHLRVRTSKQENMPIFCVLVMYFMTLCNDYVHMVSVDKNRSMQIKGTKTALQNCIASGFVHRTVLRKYRT
jgi:hypothetical protein